MPNIIYVKFQGSRSSKWQGTRALVYDLHFRDACTSFKFKTRDWDLINALPRCALKECAIRFESVKKIRCYTIAILDYKIGDESEEVTMAIDFYKKEDLKNFKLLVENPIIRQIKRLIF